MKYDPEKHHRRSIRLKGYDYSQAGAYFITIVTQDRACLFGEVVDGEIQLNDVGHMVHDVDPVGAGLVPAQPAQNGNAATTSGATTRVAPYGWGDCGGVQINHHGAVHTRG